MQTYDVMLLYVFNKVTNKSVTCIFVLLLTPNLQLITTICRTCQICIYVLLLPADPRKLSRSGLYSINTKFNKNSLSRSFGYRQPILLYNNNYYYYI